MRTYRHDHPIGMGDGAVVPGCEGCLARARDHHLKDRDWVDHDGYPRDLDEDEPNVYRLWNKPENTMVTFAMVEAQVQIGEHVALRDGVFQTARLGEVVVGTVLDIDYARETVLIGPKSRI